MNPPHSLVLPLKTTTLSYPIHVHIDNDDDDDVTEDDDDIHTNFEWISNAYIQSNASPSESSSAVFVLEQPKTYDVMESDDKTNVIDSNALLPEPRSISPLFLEDLSYGSSREEDDELSAESVKGNMNLRSRIDSSNSEGDIDVDSSESRDGFLCTEDADYLPSYGPTATNDDKHDSASCSSMIHANNDTKHVSDHISQSIRNDDFDQIDFAGSSSSESLVEFNDIRPISMTKRVRKFLLTAKDEVHVTPCQCALRLMAGMQSTDKDIVKDTNLTSTPNIERKTGSKVYALQSNIEDIGGVEKSYDLQQSSSFQNEPSPIRQRPSRSAEKLYNNGHLLDFTLNPRIGLNMESTRNRNVVGDHEITLVRFVDDHEKGRNVEVFENERWSIITVRCTTHDEMDFIIEAFRSHIQDIKVVPFSYEVKDKKRRHRRNRSRSLMRSPRMSSTKFFWKHSDSCEYCHSHFTLLTRRHHCRKCHVSACSDCSCIVYVTGGKPLRFCNKCYQDNISSLALKSRKKANEEFRDVAFSGKVHSQCAPLGVGKFGMLPHWRNWCNINNDKRPAIGRLTIELIQALSLPSADEVTGKSDPYVRATITGYDLTRDLFIAEWMLDKRYSLQSSFCSGTLSPVWRGSGLKGGELLTLPVISTAGAILRLEIFHFDVFSNDHSSDKVLGIIEIPLSDLPNANSRTHDAVEYDGFVDRWYHVNTLVEEIVETGQRVPLACAIDDPRKASDIRDNEENPKRTAWKKTLDSLDEIGKRFNGLCKAPLLWSVKALGVDLLPWYTPEVNEMKSKASLHVRIKLNVSSSGDVLSHCWEPPIIQRDKIPFDPQITLHRIQIISQKLRPYQTKIKFCEDVIRWRKPAFVCIQSYIVFAIHLYFIEFLIILLHIYLIVFFEIQRRRFCRGDIPLEQESSNSFEGGINSEAKTPVRSNNMQSKNKNSPSLELLNRTSKANSDAIPPIKKSMNQEPSHMNAAIRWIVKMAGNNRGLASIQFKLGLIARDVTVLNSLWDGSNIYRTEAALIYFIISLFIHLYFVRLWRVLWITTSAIAYFSSSPFFVQVILGFGRGVSKYRRRQHLHRLEVEKHERLTVFL